MAARDPIHGGRRLRLLGFHPPAFPGLLGEDPTLDLVAAYSPRFYHWIQVWYYVTPGLAVLMGGLVLLAVWRVWFASRTRGAARPGRLPDWPLRPTDEGPGIVIGEVHHPVEAREIFKPSWLTIPERGLYTGVAIFGAVGSGKTSACMHPVRPADLVLAGEGSRITGRRRWCSRSREISAMTSAAFSPRRAGRKTTSSWA